MRIPTATYRIQFNSEFRFENAKAIASYLADLGVSELYASPIFKARAGSTHGYDVVDPSQINPELGSEEDFDALVQEIQNLGLGWLQDIVPNHMAYDSQNLYLMDILENGPASRYLDYFDIAWVAPFGDPKESILTPLLGDFYGTCLENGEIQLSFETGGLFVNYYSLKIPLRLESYLTFLSYNLGSLAKTLGRKDPDFIKLLGILYMLKTIPADTTDNQRKDQSDFIKYLLWELYQSNPEVEKFIQDNLKAINGEKGNSESFNRLDQMLTEQFFRLAYWKVGADEMNYRRFFTVNELISVRVEDLKVFNRTHDLITKMVSEGKFTGLRIDHIDGLYNPTEYLERLKEKMGDTYVTVEKILEPGEDLPPIWDIQGTSGYDYLNYLNGIFCKTDNRENFDRIYWEFTGSRTTFEQIVNEKKHMILSRRLSGDLDNLANLLKKISSKHRYGNDFTLYGLRQAIAEVLVCFPIYRTYITSDGVLESDKPYIQSVLQTARENAPSLEHEFDFIEKLMLLDFEPGLTQAEKEQWIYFVMRLQQYSGPLMAKGVEDTALYIFNRLISLNEVGGNPASFGVPAEDFHAFNQHRQQRWPDTMNTTSTHDTKRGEDVRARINVLSEIPEEWHLQVHSWSELNRIHKVHTKRFAIPSNNDEYLIYQTLVGAFPFDGEEIDAFRKRVEEYVIKAIREAKVFTTWLENNPKYENACIEFVQKILDPADHNGFLQAFLPFQKRIAFYGIFNTLAQVLFKVASPGLPDFYQGTELWDFSLVDPDNRRPIDFGLRQSYLNDIQSRIDGEISELIAELMANRTDGRIKLFLTYQALKARNQYLDVFRKGEYIPLTATGSRSEHVVAFARHFEGQTIVAIAPRFLTSLLAPEEDPLGEKVWQDTRLPLPQPPTSGWKNLLTHETLPAAQDIYLRDALKQFPVALLVSQM